MPASLKETFLVPLVFLTVQAVSWASFSESWYVSRGRADLVIHNYKAAIEAFEKTLEIDPDNREAEKSLAVAYEKQGLRDKAIEHYDHYLRKYPGDAEAALKQAELMQSPGLSYRRQDALKYYQMALSAKDVPRVRFQYANCLGQREETLPQAIQEYEKVLAKEPRHSQARRGLLRARLWQAAILGRKEETFTQAIDQYEIVLKEYPHHAKAYAEMIRLRLADAGLRGAKRETLPQAIRQYKAVLDREPGNVTAHVGLARAYAWLGDPDSAFWHINLARRYSRQ